MYKVAAKLSTLFEHENQRNDISIKCSLFYTEPRHLCVRSLDVKKNGCIGRDRCLPTGTSFVMMRRRTF